MNRLILLVMTVVLLVSCSQAVTSPLSNTAWQVISVNGNAVEGQNVPTLRFDASTIEGKGLCNSYSAEYQVNGDALTITPVVATEMACEDVIFNIIEQDFFGALNVVTGYAIRGDDLQLLDLNGAVIVLLRKAP